MCDDLCTVFKEVAKSEIAQDEEGNVLYFVEKDKNGASKVLSLSKLKTLEYRLFRKMREKLRNFFNLKDYDAHDFDGFTRKFKQFKSEAKELSDEHELPRPLEYYFGVFEYAYSFIAQDPETRVQLLHAAYVTFSE
jgi:hypothetical protein